MPHPGNDGVGMVSLSIGVTSEVPDFTREMKQLIEVAERAPYAAKHTRRNRSMDAEQLEEQSRLSEVPVA